MAVREGMVDGAGAAIHYLDWGGDGPPLVLVHATGFLGSVWRPIAELLSPKLRVVAMDQRGHGDSDKPPDGYGFETFADDLQALIEGLDLDRPLAAGHSSGGTTIVMHGSRHPGVVRRAVFIEPILPRPDWYARPPAGRNANSLARGARRRRAVWPDRRSLLEAYRTRDTFKGWRQDVLRLYVEDGTWLREDGRAELKCPPDIEARFFEATRHIDPWPMLAELDFPALVLWGAESHLHARGLGDRVQEALRRGRTEIVPAATHFLPQERPDVVARLMESFLLDGSTQLAESPRGGRP